MNRNNLILITLFYMVLISNNFFAQNQSPIVENVRFKQRADGSLLVDIYYDVNDANEDQVSIMVKVSDNGGATYNLSANSLTGDVGENISVGSNKHIVWDFGADYTNYFNDQIQIKIVADDGFIDAFDKNILVNYSEKTESEINELLNSEGISTELSGGYYHKLEINGGGGYYTNTRIGIKLTTIPTSGAAKGVSDASDAYRTSIGKNALFTELYGFNSKGYVDVGSYINASNIYMILDSKWGTNKDTYIYLWFTTDSPLTEIDYGLFDDHTDDFGYINVTSYKVTKGSQGVPCPNTPIVTYVGKTYNTVQIGDQCWLKENLDVGTMIESTQGGYQQTNNGTIEKYCYDNDANNCETYGGLYEWPEAMQYSKMEGSQGICPQGWHIPTQAEFEELEDYVNDEATKLIDQEANTEYTYTNETGFSTLFTGYLFCDNGYFYKLNKYTYFWSSKENGINYANTMYLFSNRSDVILYYSFKNNGFSVRCLKDQENNL